MLLCCLCSLHCRCKAELTENEQEVMPPNPAFQFESLDMIEKSIPSQKVEEAGGERRGARPPLRLLHVPPGGRQPGRRVRRVRQGEGEEGGREGAHHGGHVHPRPGQ